MVDLLSTIPGLPTVNDALFAISVVLGASFHFLKKVARNETTASFTEWFGHGHWASSLNSLCTIFLAIFAALATNLTVGMGFYALVYAGFTTGFTIDSSLNSDGSRKATNILELGKLANQVEKAEVEADTIKKVAVKKKAAIKRASKKVITKV